MSGQTLYDKLWDDHFVHQNTDGSSLIYIDRHLVHEVTSPQAFEGLRLAGRQPWRSSANLAVADHNVPTKHRELGVSDPISRLQIETLDRNCTEFGITEFDILDPRQGIVHVIGPEQGATLPGMTVVCGDSHTSTHGAFGALAFGIGTSEVEHVLATQCLVQKKSRNMLINVTGNPGHGISAKDIALAIIGRIGTAGGTGYAIEFAERAIESLSMEGRMTVCNMAIEAGARAGIIAVDDTTIEYVKGRPFAPANEYSIESDLGHCHTGAQIHIVQSTFHCCAFDRVRFIVRIGYDIIDRDNQLGRSSPGNLRRNRLYIERNYRIKFCIHIAVQISPRLKLPGELRPPR